jgi:hypothetical protein
VIRKFVIPVTRYGAPSASDGIVDTPIIDNFDIRASVQPLKAGELMQIDPDLREARENYRIYTDRQLFTADKFRQADTVNVYGNDFTVFSVEKWQNGLRSHYKAVITR